MNRFCEKLSKNRCPVSKKWTWEVVIIYGSYCHQRISRIWRSVCPQRFTLLLENRKKMICKLLTLEALNLKCWDTMRDRAPGLRTFQKPLHPPSYQASCRQRRCVLKSRYGCFICVLHRFSSFSFGRVNHFVTEWISLWWLLLFVVTVCLFVVV